MLLVLAAVETVKACCECAFHNRFPVPWPLRLPLTLRRPGLRVRAANRVGAAAVVVVVAAAAAAAVAAAAVVVVAVVVVVVVAAAA